MKTGWQTPWVRVATTLKMSEYMTEDRSIPLTSVILPSPMAEDTRRVTVRLMPAVAKVTAKLCYILANILAGTGSVCLNAHFSYDFLIV